MSNPASINEKSRFKNEFLRESLAILVRNHGPEDIIQTLAAVLDAYAFEYARKTGDYDGACAMRLASDHLDGLEAFVTNYDGGEA
jgi:hypothetical protein